MRANFKVTFNVDEKNVSAAVAMVVGQNEGVVNVLNGQAAIDIYNAITGENLTLGDVECKEA